MKCLVLGGAGFIGSHLCRGLLEAGHAVRVFEKEGVNLANIAEIYARLEIVEDDFSDSHGVRDALKGMDAVFHLVGTTIPQSSNEDVVFDVMTNLVPTLNLIDGCRARGVKKILFASSGGTVYGVPDRLPIAEDHPTRPISAYGVQKLSVEKYLEVFRRMSGSDYAVLRIANPYGGRQRPDAKHGAVAVFVNKALRGEPIEIWGDGKTVRDFIHVSDVVKAFLAALNANGASRIYNVGSGRGHTLLELVARIEDSLGRPVARKFLDSRAVDVPANVLSIERAGKELGWAPEVSFADGVARVVADAEVALRVKG
jgi:UDP-glucose 4-epimerase